MLVRIQEKLAAARVLLSHKSFVTRWFVSELKKIYFLYSNRLIGLCEVSSVPFIKFFWIFLFPLISVVDPLYFYMGPDQYPDLRILTSD
jgi:hypothetical protein